MRLYGSSDRLPCTVAAKPSMLCPIRTTVCPRRWTRSCVLCQRRSGACSCADTSTPTPSRTSRLLSVDEDILH